MDNSVKSRVVETPKRVLRSKLDQTVFISDQIKVYGRVAKPSTRQLSAAMVFYVMAELRASDEQRNT